MKIRKKRKQMEDPIILLPRTEEEVHDLSWMIRNDSVVRKPVKKQTKKKKK